MRSDFISVTKMQYKIECHKLIQFIWGDTQYARSQAYIYLSNRWGRTIHFADINNMEFLQNIWLDLENKASLKKRVKHRKKVRVIRYTVPEPEVSPKKLKIKREFKNEYAPNIKHLVRENARRNSPFRLWWRRSWRKLSPVLVELINDIRHNCSGKVGFKK